ncbi:MAG: ketopantoate reductase family protein [Chloroflexi bacterium]|nr:ketopantoate reductase family protein [Chloroflexota bacterium]
MKLAIFGTGGVGGYFGGRLAKNGEDITFIARGEHLAALRHSGLRVESIDGDFTVHPVNATDSPQSVGVVDLVILATKAWQLDEAITQMKPLLGNGTVILPLLNGMEHMDLLIHTFGTPHVIGGLCRISAFIGAPGVIRHVGMKPYIAYGEWDNSPSERIQIIHNLFSSIDGIAAENPANIQTAMWEKFIFITGTSGVGAYTGKPIGEYRANPETRAMLFNAFSETAAVARAMGAPIEESFVSETMQQIDNAPGSVMASMQKDMMAGKPSELNAQTGAVIRMGKAASVPTPTHEKLFAALLPLEQKARSR